MYAKQYEQAEAKFRAVVKLEATAKYYFNLCTAQLLNGRSADAKRSCTNGLARNPDAALRQKLETMIERADRELGR
jgi:hypothetical protein